jgi:O-antigen/teichoic acid export membrane protein
MSVDRERTAKSALWSLIENAGLALISMGTLVIYTHLLSTAEFGLFAVVLALIELLQIFVTMFFHDALVQRQDTTELHFDTAFTVSVALACLLSLVCVLAAPLFAAAVSEPQAAGVLRAMSLCFPAAALSATIVARQRRELSFRPLALRSLVGRFAGAAIGVALILAGAGVWGLIAQQVLIQAVGSAILWKTCENRPRLRFGRKELRELSAFGLYSMGSLFLVFGVKRIFAVVTGIFLGVEVAGYLNLSFRAVDVFWSIAATAATQVALPTLASLQHDLPALRRAFQFATSFVCVVLYACFIGIGVLSPEIVGLMFGEKWLPAAPYISVLALLVLVQGPRVLVAPLLTALGRPRDLLLSKAAELVFVLAALFATRVPSLSWAIGIWVARELLALPITARLLKRAMGLGALDQLRGAAVPLAASSSLVAAVLSARYLLPQSVGALGRLLVLVPVGAAAFLGAAFVLDRELVKSLLAFVQSALGRAKRSSPQPGLAAGAP